MYLHVTIHYLLFTVFYEAVSQIIMLIL